MLYGIIVVVVVVLDQATKAAVRHLLDVGESTGFIPGVLGGGVGNMIDRMVMGYVTDFLATTFVSFPVFNVADMFVTCGVVISFVIYTAWESRREHAAAKADVSSHEA